MVETIIQLQSLDEVKEFNRAALENHGDITLFSGKYIIDGKSIMGILSMDLSKPIKVEVEDPVNKDVLQAIDKFRVVS
ncbi:MAG: HPr family phosphocarrier protein [Firmicutes bacterium]|nr:HPr family phosphocarrier protein [Bacillota bacterium]